MYREGLFHELAESEKIFCMDCRLESAQKFNQGAKKRGHAEQGEKSHKLFWNFSLQATDRIGFAGFFLRPSEIEMSKRRFSMPEIFLFRRFALTQATVIFLFMKIPPDQIYYTAVCFSLQDVFSKNKKVFPF